MLHAVDSVIAQTHRNLELIVIDDGSTDGTGELLKRCHGDDPRITYIWQEQAGVANARNVGLAHVRGELVAFLDSDDAWRPWKLAFQVECLRRFPKVGLVWTNMVGIDAEGKPIPGSSLTDILDNYHRFALDELFSERVSLASLLAAPPEARDGNLWIGDVFSKMVIGNLVLPSSSVVTRERLEQVGRFDERLRVAGEDFDFFLRISEHGPVAFADVPGVLKSVGQRDQLSHPARHLYLARNYVRTMDAAIERADGRIDLPPGVLRDARARGRAWTAQAYLEAGDATCARQFIRESLRLRPLDPKTLVIALLAMLPGAVSRRVLRLLRRVVEARRDASQGGQ
jgi:glycosyltransferase involved in cell wall biosynthesis